MNDIQHKILSLAHKNGTDVLYAAETIIKEQAARIARLEDEMNGVRDCFIDHDPVSFSDSIKVLNDVLNESPQQSLAAIQADAVEQVKFNSEDAQLVLNHLGDGSFGSDDYEMMLDELHFIGTVILANKANTLRDKA